METPLHLPTDDAELSLHQLSSPADDAAYFEAVSANQAHLSQFGDTTAQKYQTLEAVRQAREQAGPVLRMGMWHGETFVGFVKATPDPAVDLAEIGYWVDGRHTGHGYAALGARALARHISIDYSLVVARVIPGNHASSRTLEKAGFQHVASGVSALVFRYQPTDAAGFC